MLCNQGQFPCQPLWRPLSQLVQECSAAEQSVLYAVLTGRLQWPPVCVSLSAVQVLVGPLPSPTNWSYVPLGPSGQMEASWLQRPYSMSEANQWVAAHCVPCITWHTHRRAWLHH